MKRMQYSSVATSETSFIELPPKKVCCTTNLIPVVFLSLFAWTLTSTVVQDQIVYQVCTVEMRFSQTDCLGLRYKNETNSVELEEKVQPYAANLLMVKNLTEALLSILFTLFIGPWSDKFGRKPVLIVTSIGFFLTYLTLAILNACSVMLSAWFYVLAFGFIALCGGHVTLFVAIYCYVTDTSTDEERSTNLVVIEAVLSAGIVVGSMSSSYVYAWYGITIVMAIATVATFISLFWTIFILRESRVTQYSLAEKFKGIFCTQHIQDLVTVCTRKRTANDRSVLWTVMLSLGLSIFVLQGVECVIFLFLREHFQWGVREYTQYSAIATVVLILSNFVIIYCLKPLTKLKDETLVVLSFLSACASSIVVALATKSWHMYLGVGLSCLMGVTKPMCRAILATISRRTDETEIGKIFSLTAAMEAVAPVLSVPLYTVVYKATLTSYPGAFNLISIEIWGLCAIFLTVAFHYQKIQLRRAPYEPLES